MVKQLQHAARGTVSKHKKRPENLEKNSIKGLLFFCIILFNLV
jgi:hypothetical protein